MWTLLTLLPVEKKDTPFSSLELVLTCCINLACSTSSRINRRHYESPVGDVFECDPRVRFSLI